MRDMPPVGRRVINAILGKGRVVAVDRRMGTITIKFDEGGEKCLLWGFAHNKTRLLPRGKRETC